MQAPESTHLEWYSGSTSACHAEDRGSIPRSRDLFACKRLVIVVFLYR